MAFTGLQYEPNYTDGTNNGKSSIDYKSNADQMNTFYWIRKSLTDARKESYFTQMADSIGMPQHYGKKIKLYHYIPLLDDRNVNDQGIDAKGAKTENGNLFGSSRDIGTILEKLPTVGEAGGRVNRVGFSRIELEGTFKKFGVFYEWTRESFEFDSDSTLRSHLSEELMKGMVEMQEKMLNIDLVSAAGVQVFPGTATQKSEVTGEGDNATIVDYKTLRKTDQILDENRCPRNTKYISGSRNIDTKTIYSARVAYVPSAVVPVLEDMKDNFGNKAFIPVQQYASAGNVMRGEIGSIGHFRFIQVPEAVFWEGTGATVTTNPGYAEKGSKYNVYPILVVGSESFNTINYSGASGGHFSIITKVPGREMATKDDPYGETGFSSLKFYYGFLCKRPERIAVIHTVAPE